MNIPRFIIKIILAILLLTSHNTLLGKPPPAPQTYGSITELGVELPKHTLFATIPFIVKIVNPTDSPIFSPVIIYRDKQMIQRYAKNISPQTTAKVIVKIDTPGAYTLQPGNISIKIKPTPKFLINEILKFNIFYKFLKIGYQEFSAKRISDTLVVFKNKSKSTVPFVKIDDEMTSYFYLPQMVPLRFVKKIREMGYSADIEIIFNHDAEICTVFSKIQKRPDAPISVNKTIKKINNSCQDEISMVYYIRSLPNINSLKQYGIMFLSPVEYTIQKIGETLDYMILAIFPLKMKVWMSKNRERIIEKILYTTRFVPLKAVLAKE